ncbi:hypothetical protein [Nocardia farcinica]|uniref:hypothetical protein n=1 Tax=Nocardia farcinica TaxID=37329 RepID=UPI0024573EC8|nr:hypothetical protein [Nocardia farcinica]
MPSDPPWTRDELILACDITMQNGWLELREHDPRVHELSHLLRSLPIHPPERRGPAFRSVGSVSRKTTDIMTAHPAYRGKMTKGGKLTKQVLLDFIAESELMHQAAETIRSIAPESPAGEAVEPAGWDVAFVDECRFSRGKTAGGEALPARA